MNKFNPEIGDIRVSRLVLKYVGHAGIRNLARFQQKFLESRGQEMADRQFIEGCVNDDEMKISIVLQTDTSRNNLTQIFLDYERDYAERGYFLWSLVMPMLPSVELGEIAVTEAARESLGFMGICNLVEKQRAYDWGEVDFDDWEANDKAVHLECGRIFSSHSVGSNKFFVITEADRSVTTIMLASEY